MLVANMEAYQFKYVSVACSAVGTGTVGVTLKGDSGNEFIAVLSVEDARRLVHELLEQIRIADRNTS